jgi:pimeloyl-ACP methyl ester carboxylesterase
MARIYVVFVAFILGSFGSLVAISYYLSNQLLYYRRSPKEWAKPKKLECSDWLRKTAYASVVPGKPNFFDPDKPAEMSCESALSLVPTDFHAVSKDGLKIHYVTFPPETDRPVFLHIHGIAGNYLHGLRYKPMAERLGFQFVGIDLGNHGKSDHTGKGAAYGCREDGDIIAVVEDILKQSPGRDFYLHATSMGAMALSNAMPYLMASQYRNQIVAVSLENPIRSVSDIVLRSPKRPPLPDFVIQSGLAMAGWRSGFSFESCKPVDNVPFARIPILIQWSENDDLVTKELVEEFVSALPAHVPHRFEVFKGGSHSAVWNADPAAYERQTKENWESGLKYRSEF